MLTDDERNILAGLAHEGCDNCPICGEHVCPRPVSPTRFEWPFGSDDEDSPYCEEHAEGWDEPDYEQIAEDRAEFRRPDPGTPTW